MNNQIIIMKPGEKPTEPGWYAIASRSGGSNIIINMSIVENGVLGDYDHEGKFYSAQEDDNEFIARIYPERITRME